MSQQTLDIFISYRRDGGCAFAQLLYERLKKMGYRVFFDIDEMRSGAFNTQLLTQIEQARDVVVVLPPDSLERCCTPDDWFRLEIEHAIGMDKNIIPVLMEGFVFPPMSELPASLVPLPFYQGVTANMEYLDASIERLERYLTSRAYRNKRRRLRAVLPAVALLAVAAAGVLFQKQAALPQAGSPFSSVAASAAVPHPTDLPTATPAPTAVPLAALVAQGSYNGSDYFVYAEDFSWSEAEAWCLTAGGHLASLTTEEEAAFVQGLLEDAYESMERDLNAAYFFVGGKQGDTGWQWITGEAFGYTNWQAGQPDGSGSCLRIVYAPRASWSWTWDDTVDTGSADIPDRGFVLERSAN